MKRTHREFSFLQSAMACKLTIPWRALTPKPEILTAAGVKPVIAPVLAWAAARSMFHPMGEAQFAAVLEGATPAVVTTLLLADRFRLDHDAAALLIGWSTILFWLTLPPCAARRIGWMTGGFP